MKNLLRPEKILLVFGLVFGLTFLFLTPPFQVADEGVHFFRSYQTAQGELVDPTIPSSAVATAAKFNHLPFHPEKKTSFTEIVSLLSLPLEPQNTQKIPSIAYPTIRQAKPDKTSPASNPLPFQASIAPTPVSCSPPSRLPHG